MMQSRPRRSRRGFVIGTIQAASAALLACGGRPPLQRSYEFAAQPLPCSRQRGAEASRGSGSMCHQRGRLCGLVGARRDRPPCLARVPPHRASRSVRLCLSYSSSWHCGGRRPACAYLFYRLCLCTPKVCNLVAGEWSSRSERHPRLSMRRSSCLAAAGGAGRSRGVSPERSLLPSTIQHSNSPRTNSLLPSSRAGV
jgi:hypothetical protein